MTAYEPFLNKTYNDLIYPNVKFTNDEYQKVNEARWGLEIVRKRANMATTKTNLVIVESPAKARTIEKYLGKDYKVIASMGHLRDLPKNTIGVDIEACDRKISPAVCRRFLNGCDPDDAIQRWTERESFGKLTGEGAASQTIPFDADTLCFHSFVVAAHLLTVCHKKTDPPSSLQEL